MTIAGRIAARAAGRGRQAAAGLIALALPPRCPGCGMVTPTDHAFCLACWTQLDFLVGPACAGCGAPFLIDPGADARCGACLVSPPALDRVEAAVAYGDIARRLVLRLKYGGRPGLAETIARQLDRFVIPADAILAPVPLHRWRIWSRGYNQSALIARALARRRGLTVRLGLIARIRATPVLRGMGPAARARAVRGAFALGQEGAAAGVKGRAILLIDDVYTTGATANACAKLLKRAGAAEVRLLCWARVTRGESGDVDIDDRQPHL